MTLAFDVICAPFRGLPPAWGLIAISLVTGVLLLWIFGKVSNQSAIRVIRDRIRGNLIGVRLFQNDIAIVLRLQGRILLDTLVYMRYSVVPMFILMIPVLLIMTQLNLRFAVRPLYPGETTILEVRMKDGQGIREGAVLEAPEGVVVETPAVHSRESGRISWRIRAEAPGRHTLQIHTPKGSIQKGLVVSERWGPVPTLRAASLFDQFFFPGEPAVPSKAPFHSIHLEYSTLPITFFGIPLNWIVAFFIFSLIAGFACKDLLGVEF